MSAPSHIVSESSVDARVVSHSPLSRGLLSLVVPGLGQFRQRRWWLAGLQFSTVAAYLFIAARAAGGRALWFAVFWNEWSAIDAYLHERRD